MKPQNLKKTKNKELKSNEFLFKTNSEHCRGPKCNNSPLGSNTEICLHFGSYKSKLSIYCSDFFTALYLWSRALVSDWMNYITDTSSPRWDSSAGWLASLNMRKWAANWEGYSIELWCLCTNRSSGWHGSGQTTRKRKKLHRTHWVGRMSRQLRPCFYH